VVRVRTLLVTLLAADLVILLLHVLLSRHPYLGTVFDLDAEGNVPTWYSSFKFTLAAGAAVLCRRAEDAAARPARRRYSWGWLLIGALMLAMSIDETGQLHEALTNWLMASPLGANLRATFEASKESGTMLWGVVFAPFLLLAALACLVFYYSRFKRLPWLMAGYGVAVALLATSLTLETKEAELLGAPGFVSSARLGLYRIDIAFEEMAEVLAGTAFVVVHYAYAVRTLPQKATDR
jgi:drug/metabolite transporter (DMT)-like permease